MDGDAAEPVSREEPRPESTAAWLCTSAGIHLLLWGVVFWFLCAHVPRQKATFDDFGLPVSAATVTVLRASDLAKGSFYLAAPLVAATVFGIDYLIVSLLRSPVLRTTLIALLVIPPIGLVTWWNLVLLRELSGLMEKLR